jgi:hypothetical protein
MIRKPKIAYYRKLYLAYLIDTEKHNVVSLEEKTGMHKRTIQTSMKAFEDIGISFEFVQKEGALNKQGHYKITQWGDHKKAWIKDNMLNIVDVLR